MADQMERRMIRFPQPMLDDLAARATANGRTVSAEIRLACTWWLDSDAAHLHTPRPAEHREFTPQRKPYDYGPTPKPPTEVQPRFKGSKASPGK